MQLLTWWFVDTLGAVEGGVYGDIVGSVVGNVPGGVIEGPVGGVMCGAVTGFMGGVVDGVVVVVVLACVVAVVVQPSSVLFWRRAPLLLVFVLRVVTPFLSSLYVCKDVANQAAASASP